MNKTYQIKDMLGLSIQIKPNGKMSRVLFRSGSHINGVLFGATFSTVDGNIQKGIENHPYYRLGRIVCLTPEEPEVKPVKVKKEVKIELEITEIKGITTGQDAITKLVEMGYREAEIGEGIDSIVAFAKEKKVSFPNWGAFTKR